MICYILLCHLSIEVISNNFEFVADFTNSPIKSHSSMIEVLFI